jgi:solute carrier family 13 (sodium-dependent dicarboxylate transporter), member 2/3/5
MRVVKAHAYGNDFLLVEEGEVPAGVDRPGLARRICDRHRGIGADGLMIYRVSTAAPGQPRATMRLLNADGSRSEVSGNGVRCLAVLMVMRSQANQVAIDTEAGEKRLSLVGRDARRYTFRAAMGLPTELGRQTLDVMGRPLDVVTLRVGNPQCVVLGPATDERLHGIARALATHPAFPEGTNVELADVERPDLVRIRIWERGVGTDLRVRNRRLRGGGGGCRLRRGRPRRDRCLTRGGAARRVDRQRAVSHRVGRSHPGWHVAGGLRKPHEAVETVEAYSPAEERFNRRRRTVGLFLGPAVFALLLLVPMPGLSPAAHRLAAILALMVVLWITEALPLPITAVAGPVLAVLLGVAQARAAFAPFADPIIFLFIGSFILAEAMFVHGLDRRIAFSALSLRAVGRSPGRILIAYGTVTAIISMWISNTATTAMMFPLGLAIVGHLASGREREPAIRRYAMAMMLITAFAASIGGLGTPVGTPPNLIGLALLRQQAGIDITFDRWMLLGIPIVILVLAGLFAIFQIFAVRGVTLAQGGADLVREELRRLGPITRGQRNVMAAFFTTAVLWLLPGLFAITGQGGSGMARAYASLVPESVAAMVGAILLFVLPVHWPARRFTLSWDEASRIDWGIVLLFGGGLSMGALADATGLAAAMGRSVAGWMHEPSPLLLTAVFTAAAIVISEAASNTASATIIVPIAIAVAQAAGVSPLEPALGATLGASMGFMMPISTPPNAIVYSSGHVPITQMMRYGVMLDVLGFFVILAAVMGLGRFVV